MIYSTGIDLVDIDRIRSGYEQYGQKYLERLFSEREIEDIVARKSGMYATMAGKFAAKEAVMKSLGVFFDSGVALRDIEILNRSTGMPYVQLPERLGEKLAGKSILLSISHERKYATAVVVITDEE